MLVSQYEILINKKQFPDDLAASFPRELQNLSREVLQGYFLTLSNLSTQDANIVVSFRVVTDSPAESPFDADTVTAVFDFKGENQMIMPIIVNSNTRNYAISLPAKDTGLFILQPNPGVITDISKTVEIRGYVDVSLLFNESGEEIDLLLTPEHRGTFYKRQEPTDVDERTFVDLDQIAYTLPTANGGSLFKLS